MTTTRHPFHDSRSENSGGGGLSRPSSPGLPLAVDQQVVEQEEDALLDVARRDFQQVPVQQQLRADICQVGSLKWFNKKTTRETFASVFSSSDSGAAIAAYFS